MKKYLPILTLWSIVLPVFADQITMKNGDRLTGQVQSVDEKELVFKSDLAGVVKIPWDSVDTMQSAGQLNLILKDGQTIVGTLMAEGTQYRMTTQQAGTVTTEKAAIQAIRSDAEQKRYLARIERLENPRLLDLWTGVFDLGYAAARGNASTNSLSVNALAARTTKRDKIQVYFTSINTRARVEDVTQQTANAIRGGLKYNVDLTRKVFAFGGTDLEFDEFQQLDLRWVIAGGGGYHVIRNDRTTFDLSGGFAYNREFFSTGLQRNSAEVVLGDELLHKFNQSVTLSQRLFFYPNITNTGNYRINFDIALVAAINKWLGWNVTFSDRYLSNPIPGNRKNDMIFTTGLRLTFTPPPIE